MRLLRWTAVPIAFLVLAGTAAGAPRLSFHVALQPEQLGHETTITFALQMAPGRGERVPPPLTRLRLAYPSSIGLAVSGLGLSSCSQQTLEVQGPRGCPADSLIGRGSALAAFPIGPEVVYVHASTEIERSPEPNHIAMYFNVESEPPPVLAQLVLPGLLAPTRMAGYEQIDLEVPLFEGIVGGSYVSVTHLSATLGPRSLTYYERVGNKFVAYKPKGILLPRRCPRHGFRFSASLLLLGGTTLTARSTAPCG